MKLSSPSIAIAPKAERPFPEKEIIWASEEGGSSQFPSREAAYLRLYSNDSNPLIKFVNAIRNSQERVWLLDEYLLVSDRENPEDRIDKILSWFPLRLAASDIRLLTKHHGEIEEADLVKFQHHANEISKSQPRRGKECQIQIKMHLTRSCNFIHDRFAIIDDELWHFGATVGGFHSKINAATRGWRASEHGAIEFFENIWNLER